MSFQPWEKHLAQCHLMWNPKLSIITWVKRRSSHSINHGVLSLWQILNAFRCSLFLYHHINNSAMNYCQSAHSKFFLLTFLNTSTSCSYCYIEHFVWWHLCEPGWIMARWQRVDRRCQCFVWTLCPVFSTLSTLPCLSHNHLRSSVSTLTPGQRRHPDGK